MEKLLSRKFLITVAAIASALIGTELTPAQLAAVAAVSLVYVLAQALVDHGVTDQKTVDDVAARVITLLQERTPKTVTITSVERGTTAPPIPKPEGNT